MKKVLISMGFIALALGATAQVKIKDGTVTGSSTIPNANSILDLESSNKGLHLPRVSLQATNLPAPLNEAAFSTLDSGLVVFNLATAGTAPNNVTPGVYYCDGTQWVRAGISAGATPADDWYKTSDGTAAGNSDNQYIMGNAGIGTSAPNSTLQVDGSISMPISVQSGSYSLTESDYTVVFTGTGNVTATLPPAADISGRMYRIVAPSSATSVTVFSTSGVVMIDSKTDISGSAGLFQSNGTTWYQVQ